MATSAIIPSESLDITRIVIGDIRANKAGGKTVPIRYNGQNLVVRTPRMFYPAGVMTRVDDQGKSNYNLCASLKGCDPFAKEESPDSTSDIGAFYNFLLKFQEKVLNAAVANSSKWFGKSRTEAVLRDTMKNMLSPSVTKVEGEWIPDGKYPPSLRMKISVWDGAVSLNAVDKDNNEIAVTPENLDQVFPKRMEGRMVVAPSIYVSGLGFGVTWRVTMAKVFPPESRSAADVFKDIKEPEEKKETPAEMEATVPTTEDDVVEAPPEERAPTPPTRSITGGGAPAAPAKKRKSQVAPA
jgi:hypothetical protein